MNKLPGAVTIPALAVFSVLATGCQTTPSYDEIVGDGPLRLSQKPAAVMHRFLALQNGGSLAIDVPDGQMYFNYCPEMQCEVGAWNRAAVEDCNQRFGGPCKLIATGQDIVWRGPIAVAGKPVDQDGGSHLKAKVDRIGAKISPARYRLTLGWGGAPGDWVDGEIDFEAKGDGLSYVASFTDGVKCDGGVRVAKDRHDHPPTALPSGKTKGRCVAALYAGFDLQYDGAFEALGPGHGVIQAKGDKRRTLEIIYDAGFD